MWGGGLKLLGSAGAKLNEVDGWLALAANLGADDGPLEGGADVHGGGNDGGKDFQVLVGF